MYCQNSSLRTGPGLRTENDVLWTTDQALCHSSESLIMHLKLAIGGSYLYADCVVTPGTKHEVSFPVKLV